MDRAWFWTKELNLHDSKIQDDRPTSLSWVVSDRSRYGNTFQGWSGAPLVSKDCFSSTNDKFFVETSRKNRHRRAMRKTTLHTVSKLNSLAMAYHPLNKGKGRPQIY